MALRGAPQLRRRLKAIKTVFKPVGREWTERTVNLAQRRVAVRTGATRRSIRRKNASQTRASVQATGGARFLEAGTQAHELKARKVGVMKFTDSSGRPQFRKKVRHPGMRAQPFLRRSGRDALEGLDMLRELIELWNRAA